jgi:hypothetical protein
MSLVGGGQSGVQFSLEDEEDFDEATLASASVAFSGLTILPPQQSLASGSLVGVTGGIVAPVLFAPAQRALRLQGGVSINSGLTFFPPLSFPSSFVWVGGGGLGGSFGGRGDDEGWRPLLDANLIGKSKRIQLVLVKNTNAQICFGCIGTDDRHFCQSNQCLVRIHKKQRFNMG